MRLKIIFSLLILVSFVKAFDKQTNLEDNKIIKFLINENIKNIEDLYISKNMKKLYYKNFDYKLFWFEKNKAKEIAYELIEKIENDQVLRPKEKVFPNFKELKNKLYNIEKKENISELISLDIELTALFHKYIQLLANGYLDWDKFKDELSYINEKKEINIKWQKYKHLFSIRKLLYKVSKEEDLSIAMSKVKNSFYDENTLSKKIKEYEKFKSLGFVKIPKIKTLLKPNNSYKQIPFLRKRLTQTKDLNDAYCLWDIRFCSSFFDEELSQAVRSFQKRHGLHIDGVVGKNTLKFLNESIEKKIEKIRINIERMRLLPKNFGEKFVYVNIPEFKLKVFKNQQVQLETEVVVGQKQNPTPIFSHRMSQIIVNPYWRIPQSIVKKEIIPKLIENPNYLVEENIKVFENWDTKSMEYDVSSVDWRMYLNNDLIGDDKSAPMRFIQVPNNKNPLGKMKFLFPNRYSVYLHDTPQKNLFEKSFRAFSHGCIRVNNPSDLLVNILKDEKNYNDLNFNQLLNIDNHIDLSLDKKIPVHIVYLTAWIDENGNIQFRDDIYGFDDIQADILYNPNYKSKKLELKTLSASIE